MPGNLVEFVFRGDNRSVIRSMNQIAETSEKTHKKVQHNARETATVYEHLGHTSVALRESMGGLAGIVGLGGIAFGLKDVVQGGMQLQSQQAQLQAALKATGQDAGGTAERLKGFAETLSTKGGFATSQNLTALTAFVRETHSATQAEKGLGLASDIARGRNIDLASAQMVVQRAYGGSIGRLQALLGPMVAAKNASYGLSQAHREEVAALEQQSKSYGKLGPQWLRQQEIARSITPQMQDLATIQNKQATAQQVIAAAQRVFGGATGAYAGTTQGKVSDLQHSLDNLKETTGEKLLPVVNTLAKDATWVVNAFSKLPGPVEAGVIGFTLLGVLLAPMRHSFELLRGTMNLFRGSVETATPGVSRLGVASDVGAAETGLGGAAAGGAGTAASAARAAAKEGRLAKFLRVGGKAILPAYLGYEAFKALSPTDKINTAPVMIGGHAFYRASGGVVPPPRYLAGGGGPMGTDTVPAWLTPGEGVMNTRAMSLVGEGGLAALNAGRMPTNITIHPGVTIVKIDGRQVAEAVTRYALNKAARGPSSYTGGSLVTGAPGLPA